MRRHPAASVAWLQLLLPLACWAASAWGRRRPLPMGASAWAGGGSSRQRLGAGFLLPPLPSTRPRSALAPNRQPRPRLFTPPYLRVSTMPLNDDDDDDGHHHGDLEAMVPEEFHLAASAMGRGGSGERGGTPIDSKELVLEVLPYLCLGAEFLLVGSSAYVAGLRKKLVEAAKDESRAPVVVLGDTGTRRVDTAVLLHALAHTLKQQKQQKDSTTSTSTATNSVPLPALRMSAKDINADPARFFGGTGTAAARALTSGGSGLLDLAGERGAVIITRCEALQPHVIPLVQRLLDDGTYTSVKGEGGEEEMEVKKCKPRVLLTGSALPPGLAANNKPVRTIQLQPLRKHRADIQPEVTQILARLCEEQARPMPTVSQAAWRFLTAYDFPGNMEELEVVVEDALNKVWRRGGGEISENDLFDRRFDVQRANLRNNLLETIPWLRNLLRDINWPDGLNHNFTRYAFPLLLAGLFLGPPDRDHNVFLQFFWSWWWPAIMVIYPFLGRIWCSVCPFMIYGEWAQETLKKVLPDVKLRKWPQSITNGWGPWFLYGLFAAILYWEELWNLPQNADLSAWLLILITAGAVVFSLTFEKRLWCASLCPIGGMNGMYAKLSMLSVRTEPGLCQSCGQYLCVNNEKNGKPGCPLQNAPSQLPDNSGCINCLKCASSNCPYDNVGLYIRAPAVDIASGSHEARGWEVALMFLLMGNVFMRRLPQIVTTLSGLHLLPSLAATTAATTAAEEFLDSSFLTHAGATTAALFLPLAGAWLVHQLFQKPAVERAEAATGIRFGIDGQPVKADFVHLAYGYLPLAWAANTASWGEFFLREAGNILPVTAATFGINDAWAHSILPQFAVSPDIIGFLQAVTLLVGAGCSVALTAAIAQRPLKDLLPQIAAILGFDLLFALAILGPGNPWQP